MIADWVLIFIQLQAGLMSVDIKVQPIYFQTEEACKKVADEMNNGKTEMEIKNKQAFGAICRITK